MKKTILNLCLVGGIALATVACKNENNNAETSDAKEVANANEAAVEFVVDTTESTIEWKGEKPAGSHNGVISISEGTFTANDSLVESGSFVIDMNSIEVQDLEGDDKASLENHLKGTVEGKEGDFFNVKEFPKATFEITGVDQVEGNTMLHGNLTMKGETKNVEFPVNIDVDGDELELTSESFTIDRTQWGLNYGSKSVFDNLGDKFISDDITLTVKVKAKKA